MKGLKIAVIGAGSTYTPELINGFIDRRDELGVDSFYLMDIDMEKLKIVAGLAERMLCAAGMTCRIVLTDSLDEAIEGSDYVLTQVRIGKLEARISDEKIPLKYDLLGQETTGAGGFMKALRTVPVIMDIAYKMEKTAPGAWLVNFTNPSGIVAEAVLNNTGVKAIGLCNVPFAMIRNLGSIVPQNTDKIDFDFVGLNHLSWITAVYADEKDVLPELLHKGIETAAMKNVPSAEYDEALLRATRAIPSVYLNYYYFRDEQIKHCKESEKTRGEICRDIELQLLELYKDKNLKSKPEVLEQRGGAYYSEAAVSIINAIENDKNEIHVVNVRNEGAFPFMEWDDVVEVKCTVNKDGARPVKLDKFDNSYIIGIMRGVKAYEKLTIRAALNGDYDSALAALMVHPLIGDYRKSKGVLDEMLEANKEYLTRFSGG